MKDLKHLIYFENLLDSANNELVQQAKDEGMHPIAYTCYHMPEVVLNVDNCFSVRLRAPKTGSFDIASYYMSNYTCEYCRALVERAIEGGYNFLDAIAGVDACAEMNRCMENIELVAAPDMPNKKMFVTHCDIPYKVKDYTLKHYVKQIRNRFLNVLAETYGVDTSDKALRKAVKEHNEVCKIITEIGDMRKLENPPITGYEFHVLNLVTYCCPKSKILPYLKETLAEIKKRKVDAKPWYRCRVALIGSEIDDLDMTRMVEDAGAMIVADRFCFGSTPGREVIELNEDPGAPRHDQPSRHRERCRRHHLRIHEVLRFLGIRARAGKPHHERRVWLAGPVHRPPVHGSLLRSAPHETAGLCREP